MPADLPLDMNRCTGAVLPPVGAEPPALCELCRDCLRRAAPTTPTLYWFPHPPAAQYHGQWWCGSRIRPDIDPGAAP